MALKSTTIFEVLNQEKMTSKFNTTQEAQTTMQLALGRILRLGSRPFVEGDIEDYEKTKGAFIDAAEFLGLELKADTRSCYVRDYAKIHHD